jgi:hypothetical protein
MPSRKAAAAKEPEIVLTSGKPFVVGKALRAKSLSAGFLTAYQHHFENEGAGIFDKMYKQFPSDYFWGLVKLAQIMRVEIGQAGAFDRPQNREEALRRLEENAGTHAREMLEKFLDGLSETEAKQLGDNTNESA